MSSAIVHISREPELIYDPTHRDRWELILDRNESLDLLDFLTASAHPDPEINARRRYWADRLLTRISES